MPSCPENRHAWLYKVFCGTSEQKAVEKVSTTTLQTKAKIGSGVENARVMAMLEEEETAWQPTVEDDNEGKASSSTDNPQPQGRGRGGTGAGRGKSNAKAKAKTEPQALAANKPTQRITIWPLINLMYPKTREQPR